jgi:hypothetical protein
MPEKCKNAPLLLIIPDFNFEVVTSRNKKRLLAMKRNATNWSIMLIKLLEKRADSIIPELNDSCVQAISQLELRKLNNKLIYLAKIHGRFG